MGNNLDLIMQSWVAATVSLNSNFGDLSLKNGSIDTSNIMTLGDYMGRDNRGSIVRAVDNNNPELGKEDEKLMRTYVVPIVLAGETIDLIVDSKGRDIARIRFPEDGNSEFILDEKVKQNIAIMVGTEAIKDGNYKMEFLPDTLEKLKDKIQKDELVPKNAEEVTKRKNNAKGNFDKEAKPEDEIDKEELEKTSKELGTSMSSIEKFCEDNNITDPSKIKGMLSIKNIDSLEESMGIKIKDGKQDVILLKVDGIDGKQATYITDIEGNTLVDPKELDKPDELNDLVKEGSSDYVNDVDEANTESRVTLIEYDDNGLTEAKGGTQADAIKYEELCKQAKAKLDEKIELINSTEGLSPVEIAQKLQMAQDEYDTDIMNAQQITGVESTQIKEEARADLNEAEDRTDAVKAQEAAKEMVEGIGEVTIGAVSGGVELFKKAVGKDDNSDDKRDPRESNHDHNLDKYI